MCIFRDRKRKKYVRDEGQNPKNKKVKTESGSWVPASYKSNLYPFKNIDLSYKMFKIVSVFFFWVGGWLVLM